MNSRTLRHFLTWAALLMALAMLAVPAFAQDEAAVEPLVLQDFEGEVTFEDTYQAVAALSDVAQNGAASLSSASEEGEWHTVGASLTGAPVDLTPYNQLCFAVQDTTAGDNTVGVKLVDANGDSVERWTDNESVGVNPKTTANEWVTMCLSLMPFTGIDQTAVTQIQFTMFAAGVYYFDDVVAQVGAPVVPQGPTRLIETPIQGFEAEETYYSDYQADVSLAGDVVHGGESALYVTYPEGEWHAFGAYPDERPLDISGYDAVCFWINDTTANNNGLADNTVGVSLIDAAGTKEEVWTDNALAGENPKTTQNEWVQMCINLAAFTTVDLTQVDKVQFALYWAGDYYVDDISVAYRIPDPAADLTLTDVQTFEADDVFYSDYQADVSLTSDVVHSGDSALMITYPEGEWHAFGAYPDPRPFDASGYDAVCFWINDTTANNDGLAANTVGVSLIDAAGTKEEVWTDNPAGGMNAVTRLNEWVQMCVNLDAYTTVDLTQIDKVQFALYWAGTYYLDDISFGVAAE